MSTTQIATWTEKFGRDYTDRNRLTLFELDDLYRRSYGATRRELDERFLADIPKHASILEVGCNIGNQLRLLEQLGFSNLSGIEIQHYALRQAQAKLAGVNLVQASAFEIPFPDSSFDLVFTSGVLIHIAPPDLPIALEEIHRCARSYIWGFEYFSPVPVEVEYRGNRNLLWKMDYAQAYLDHFADLRLVRCEQLSYLENSNVDRMFLLARNSSNSRQ
jgi:pseudaminic acid biosynthesis-associated methylase